MKTLKEDAGAIRIFLFSAGLLLLATATAKFISGAGNARILQEPDPVLTISFRQVFWIVGTIEFVTAFICFFGAQVRLQASLLAWLATNFVFYRLALIWIHYHRPCMCLGNLTDALHVSPRVADTVMRIILAYLLIGSYATLFWTRRQKQGILTPVSEEKVAASGNL